MPSRTSPADRAAQIDAIEAFDGFAPLRNGLRKVAAEREDWAGIPMPIEGHRLIIHPKFPMAKELSEIGNPPPEPDAGKRRAARLVAHHA